MCTFWPRSRVSWVRRGFLLRCEEVVVLCVEGDEVDVEDEEDEDEVRVLRRVVVRASRGRLREDVAIVRKIVL